MLNKRKHQMIMGRILRDVYQDASIAPLLGFKGGTCAYFFYDLPRFSIDLDFDFIGADEEKQRHVFETIKKILEKYGEIKENRRKRFTIFFVLSYGAEDHNVKIEISIRSDIPDLKKHYALKEYLGVSMLVAKKPYLFAAKLAALTLRRKTAMRDIYDIWFFATNEWDIDEVVIQTRSGKTLQEQLEDCITVIERVNDNEILHGIGELLRDEEEKRWAKQSLRAEAVFLLKNYRSVLK